MISKDDRPSKFSDGIAKPSLFWCLKQILLTAIACFFVYFGIAMLVGAYSLKDPFSFIMTFFGASLMILISIVMAMAFLVRMGQAWKMSRSASDDNSRPSE